MKIGDDNARAIQKLLNTDIIKSIYPMIDKIQVSENANSILIVEFYLNDDSISKDNMYDRGFDPHYLVDFHVPNMLKYLGIIYKEPVGFIVWGPKTNLLTSYIPRRIFRNESRN